MLQRDLFLVATFKFGLAMNAFLQFERLDDLNDRICPESDIIFTNNYFGYRNIGSSFCSTLCARHISCNGFFYNTDTSTCIGCTGSYNTSSILQIMMGTLYYYRISKGYMQSCYPGDVCVENNQECFTDTCICSPGYSYNPGNSTCVTECNAYGTTFQGYPQRRIDGHNLFSISGGTLQECLNECVSNLACLSVDYGISANGRWKCNIQSVTAFSVAESFHERDNFTYYARDCS